LVINVTPIFQFISNRIFVIGTAFIFFSVFLKFFYQGAYNPTVIKPPTSLPSRLQPSTVIAAQAAIWLI
jgi:hypothetical protein